MQDSEGFSRGTGINEGRNGTHNEMIYIHYKCKKYFFLV